MPRTIGFLALGLALAAGPAAAPAAAQTAPTSAADSAVVPDSFADATPLAETDLGAVTGRENINTLIASASQRNTVSANSVSGNSVTGAVQIDGNAFQNLQGMAVISANSGNNVAINSSMNVVINFGGAQ